MNTLTVWATQWRIAPEALADLQRRMGTAGEQLTMSLKRPTEPASESYVQSVVRLEAAQKSVLLFRNNSGAYVDDTGRLVRYGLANDSAEINKVIKSSDLVGVRRVIITPQHVGHTIGQAVFRECKFGTWRHNPKDKHEAAQLKFGELVMSYGADFAFAAGVGTL